MRDRDTIFKELKAYTEGLAYKEKLMAEGKAVVVTPEQRRDAIELLCDTLELLKAQEPREPHYTKLEYIVNGMPVAINHPECPRCYDNGLVLWEAGIEKGAAYCKRCGQAVKWK